MSTVQPFTEIEFDKKLAQADYFKLMDWCVPISEGVKSIEQDGKMKVRVHPSHMSAAANMLKSYGIAITITDRAKLSGAVLTHGKKRMHVGIKIDVERECFLVNDNNSPKKVSFSAVDILYSLMREKKRLPPRSVWYHLSIRHKLFPEIEDLSEMVKASQFPESRKTQLISFLETTRTDKFEGMRRSGKNPDALSYYSIYWYSLLVLSRAGLVDETGNREVFLTANGEKTEDWLPVAEQAFGEKEVTMGEFLQ